MTKKIEVDASPLGSKLTGGAKKRAKVTISELAREAGVSVSTVSHALNPNPRSTIKVSPATVQRIHDVAKRIKYRPHAGARSIRASRQMNIGFFTAKLGQARFPEGYLSGFSEAADERKYQVSLITIIRKQGSFNKSIPAVLSMKSLDALVIASYSELTREIHDELIGTDLPLVYLNDRHEKNSVYLDEIHGGRTMTEHLIGRGYRRIVFAMRVPANGMTVDDLHYSAHDRIEGYRQAMEEAGLEPDVRCVPMIDAVAPNQRMDDGWLLRGGLPDAVFAYDDDFANTIGRALYRRNIRVPHDVALAGYNGGYGSWSSWSPLTTMEIPTIEMGRAAFRMAYEISARDGRREAKNIEFRSKLQIGETTR